MLSILAILFEAAVLTGVQAECQTKIQEATWNFVPGRDSSHFSIPTVESCQELCSSHPLCKGYTWRFDDIVGWCFEFQELEDLHACAGCYSGTVPIAHDGACVFSPENLVGTVSSESLEDCYQSCTETDGCQGYTWYGQATSLPNICFQLTDCSSVIPCQGCSSGELRCIVPPQCQPGGYRVLDDPTRNEDHGYEVYCDNDGISQASPDWQGEGYYRIQAPAGDKIPTSSPGAKHCGTRAPGWINDEEGAIEQMEVGQEKTVQVCFDAGSSDSCYYSTNIEVTFCPGNYYVYHLPNTPKCWLRYCASNI